MRTIIAGSRSVTEYSIVRRTVEESEITVTTVISGGARGVDTLGERWARENNIPVERHEANWKKYGKSAGMIRNKIMADNAEALIAVWDGKSHGTKAMITIAVQQGLAVDWVQTGDTNHNTNQENLF